MPLAPMQPRIGQPLTILIYGPSGKGKTTDAARAFPEALFIAQPGAVLPALTFLGYTPTVIPARTIEEVAAIHRENCLRFPAIVVDDFTLITEFTLNQLEQRFAGWELYGVLGNQILALRNQVHLSGGAHIIFNCHEQGPKVDTKTGEFLQGGPKSPGKMVRSFPAAVDCIWRAISCQWGLSHPALYRMTWENWYTVNSDPKYVGKCRLSQVTSFTPMNTGEILRAAGWAVPRLKTMPWQETTVELIAQSLEAVFAVNPGDPAAFQTVVYAAVDDMTRRFKASQEQISWTVQDGIDRALIRIRAKEKIWTILKMPPPVHTLPKQQPVDSTKQSQPQPVQS